MAGPSPSDTFKVLEVAGADPSGLLPGFDGKQVLSVVIRDMCKRAVPVPYVRREAYLNQAAGAVDIAGIVIQAVRREVAVISAFAGGQNPNDYEAGILAIADVPAFNGAAGANKDDTYPRTIIPAGNPDLTHDSVYSSGDWTAATAPLDVAAAAVPLEPNPAQVGFGTNPIYPQGIVLPAGWALVFQGNTINVNLMQFVHWEEWGP